jgi:hypothetical protein
MAIPRVLPTGLLTASVPSSLLASPPLPAGVPPQLFGAVPIASYHKDSVFFIPSTDGLPIAVGDNDQPPVSYVEGMLAPPLPSNMPAGALVQLKLWYARHWCHPSMHVEARDYICARWNLPVALVAQWIGEERRKYNTFNYNTTLLSGLIRARNEASTAPSDSKRLRKDEASGANVIMTKLIPRSYRLGFSGKLTPVLRTSTATADLSMIDVVYAVGNDGTIQKVE